MVGDERELKEMELEITMQKNSLSVGKIISRIRSFIGAVACVVGKHGWTKQSGLPGTAKYICRRCDKLNKELW